MPSYFISFFPLLCLFSPLTILSYASWERDGKRNDISILTHSGEVLPETMVTYSLHWMCVAELDAPYS